MSQTQSEFPPQHSEPQRSDKLFFRSVVFDEWGDPSLKETGYCFTWCLYIPTLKQYDNLVNRLRNTLSTMHPDQAQLVDHSYLYTNKKKWAFDIFAEDSDVLLTIAAQMLSAAPKLYDAEGKAFSLESFKTYLLTFEEKLAKKN